MSQSITTQQQLRILNRDVALMSRLFSEWTRGRAQTAVEADSRLDDIDAQLARLEQAVTMTKPVRTASLPAIDQTPARSMIVPFAANRI